MKHIVKMVPCGLELRTIRILAARSNQLSSETSCYHMTS